MRWRRYLLALMIGCVVSGSTLAPARAAIEPRRLDLILQSGALSLPTRPEAASEAEIIASLEGQHLTADEAAKLWSFYADENNIAAATPTVIEALVAATDSPAAREELWSQLGGLAKTYAKTGSRGPRAGTLLAVFEQDRAQILARLTEVEETESAADDIIAVMLMSRVFGEDLSDSVAFVSGRIPSEVSDYIERKRGAGRPVPWEYEAFESIVRWKDTHLLPGAAKAPRSLAALDAAGSAFIKSFNYFHALNPGYREVMLKGLGPVEVFNAVVAGERDLYRLGTSAYRGFLHPVIMEGIRKDGSFEAFLAHALPRSIAADAVEAEGRRGVVFLRVVTAFGLLEQVLETIKDRDRFIDEAIASLGDPASFEANSSVVMDVLTSRSGSPTALDFRRALIERLYARYRAESGGTLHNVYGSMLSVYQTVAGDHRDDEIDREFALDRSRFEIPFAKLFSPDGTGGLAHRIFMRMDESDDDVSTFAAFSDMMERLGAKISNFDDYAVFRLEVPGRRVEIYVNEPSSEGLRRGIPAIAADLRDERIETVIGRGHTSIISPLQSDARQVLGSRVKSVAAVIVGSCGGDASVRELIGTFGYIPFVTTRSTGRQLINDAIIEAYVHALLALPEGQSLPFDEVLRKATARFLGPNANEDLREDARLYQVNMTTVLSALLFDTHVRSTIATGSLRQAQN